MSDITPIDPGPLVMSNIQGIDDQQGEVVIALDLVDGSTDARDPGNIAEIYCGVFRPNWQAHAAWLVRASNNYKKLFRALMDAKEALILIQTPGIDEQLPKYARDEGHAAIKQAGIVLDAQKLTP